MVLAVARAGVAALASTPWLAERVAPLVVPHRAGFQDPLDLLVGRIVAVGGDGPEGIGLAGLVPVEVIGRLGGVPVGVGHRDLVAKSVGGDQRGVGGVWRRAGDAGGGALGA